MASHCFYADVIIYCCPKRDADLELVICVVIMASAYNIHNTYQ